MAKKPVEVNLNITVTQGGAKTPQSEPWDRKGIAGIVVKEAPEQRYTLTVAYPANKPDIAKARDGKRDFASPEAIEKAAWNYLAESPRVGQWHEDGTEGAGTIVESYIWRFDDQVIKDTSGQEIYTIHNGDWLIGTIWDEAAWQDWKSGKAKGVSMQGKATRKTPSPLDMANLRKSKSANA